MTEQGLVEAAMHGNAQAFNALVSQYQRVMVASACRIVRNTEDAEDLAQEALVDAYRHLPELRDRGRFRPWLFSILRNKCLNYLQARRPDELVIDDLDSLPAPIPAELPEVAELLDQLPLAHREILVMRYLQELEYREIADIVGANEGAVRRRCSRARAQLQALAVERNEGRLRKIMAGLLALPVSDAFTNRVAKEVVTMAQVTVKTKTAASGTAAGIAWLLGWKGLVTAGVVLAVGASVAVPVALKQMHRAAGQGTVAGTAPGKQADATDANSLKQTAQTFFNTVASGDTNKVVAMFGLNDLPAGFPEIKKQALIQQTTTNFKQIQGLKVKSIGEPFIDSTFRPVGHRWEIPYDVDLQMAGKVQDHQGNLYLRNDNPKGQLFVDGGF